MKKIEYPAMIYKNNRNKVYCANCIEKNIVAFGKTEQDALNNLKKSLQNITKSEVSVTHGFSIIRSLAQ